MKSLIILILLFTCGTKHNYNEQKNNLPIDTCQDFDIFNMVCIKDINRKKEKTPYLVVENKKDSCILSVYYTLFGKKIHKEKQVYLKTNNGWFRSEEKMDGIGKVRKKTFIHKDYILVQIYSYDGQKDKPFALSVIKYTLNEIIEMSFYENIPSDINKELADEDFTNPYSKQITSFKTNSKSIEVTKKYISRTREIEDSGVALFEDFPIKLSQFSYFWHIYFGRIDNTIF